jgi:hypothetical protein
MLDSPSKAKFDIVQTFARGLMVINEGRPLHDAESEYQLDRRGRVLSQERLIAECVDFTVKMG